MVLLAFGYGHFKAMLPPDLNLQNFAVLFNNNNNNQQQQQQQIEIYG